MKNGKLDGKVAAEPCEPGFAPKKERRSCTV
jgi:hypothetical protein